MGAAINVSENTILDLSRRLAQYEEPGMFHLDARRFLTSGHPILSEIAALQNKVDAANRQYDLDSLPLMEQDVEDAKAKARNARNKLNEIKSEEINILRNHNRVHDAYKNAVAQLNLVRSHKLDPYASKSEIEARRKDIAKAQAEVEKLNGKMSDEFFERNAYNNELAIAQAEYAAADKAVTVAQAKYKAVAKRLGVLVEETQTNELGLAG